jgi:hypothetical protein
MTPHTNPESTNDYFLALGRFIDKFAQVEKELLQLMRIFCRVPENIARAVFSGVRTDAATGYMTRVLTVQLLHPRVDQIIRKDVQYIFTQLGHINAARNSIVHYGTEFNETGYLTSNRAVALTVDRIRETPVSADIIAAMTFDLEKIGWHLRRLTIWYVAETQLPNLEKDGATFLRASWRYKPPRPASQRDKRPAKPRKRRRRPRPSQE